MVLDVLEKLDGPTASDAFAADLLRGHTETIVLAVLSRGESYGFGNFRSGCAAWWS